jgi:hypothetical protein
LGRRCGLPAPSPRSPPSPSSFPPLSLLQPHIWVQSRWRPPSLPPPSPPLPTSFRSGPGCWCPSPVVLSMRCLLYLRHRQAVLGVWSRRHSYSVSRALEQWWTRFHSTGSSGSRRVRLRSCTCGGHISSDPGLLLLAWWMQAVLTRVGRGNLQCHSKVWDLPYRPWAAKLLRLDGRCLHPSLAGNLRVRPSPLEDTLVAVITSSAVDRIPLCRHWRRRG